VNPGNASELLDCARVAVRRDETICPHIGRFRDRDGVFVSRS